jgi:hypothetical protein
MTAYGPSLHFAPRIKRVALGAKRTSGLGGSQAYREGARTYFGSYIEPTYGAEKLATHDFTISP